MKFCLHVAKSTSGIIFIQFLSEGCHYKMITERKIKQVISLIVDKFKPEKIILFGSCAKGRLSADSDIDLLVIPKGNCISNRELAVKIHSSLWGMKVPVDIKVKTKAQFDKEKGKFWTISHSAFKEGKVIYG